MKKRFFNRDKQHSIKKRNARQKIRTGKKAVKDTEFDIDETYLYGDEYDDDYDMYEEDDTEYEEDYDTYEEDETEYEEDYDAYEEDDTEYEEDYDAYEEDDTEYEEDYDVYEGDDTEYEEDYDAYEEDDTEYEEDYDEYEEDGTEYGEDYVDEEYVPPVVYDDDRFGETEPFFKVIWAKTLELTKKMSAIDLIIALTALVIVIIGGITFTSYAVAKNMNKQVQALAPVGAKLSGMGIVGESELLALADNLIMAEDFTELETEEESIEEIEEAEKDDVKVSFTSVEKDLKIKFVYGSTGNLVTGVAFEVELTDKKGKTITLKDDDQDGIIYEKNMTAGTYQALIKSVGEFEFPNETQKVTVKDKIEYVAINVQDEIKSEAQVNVAVEDTAQVNAAAEAESTPTVKDTVEWVESTKTPKSDKEEYTKISKDTITDPSTLSRMFNAMKLATLDVTLNKNEASITVGETIELGGSSFSDSSSDDEEITYSYEWSTSDKNIASVSDGAVTGKKEGTATITYKVTKKVVQNESTTEHKTKKISVDEYDKLSSSEKKNCKEITETSEEKQITDDGVEETVSVINIVGYEYSYDETSGKKNEYEETGSATCKITVKNVGIESATLVLDRSEATIDEQSMVTIAPAKIEYKYTNGTTESKKDSFPSIKWSSSDKNIAIIDEKGVVTGIKAGEAVITATVSGLKNSTGKEISASAQCKITVKAGSGATSELTLKLDPTKASVAIGKTLTIKATVTNFASDSGVTWSSSDEKIAKVDEKGVITGIKAGSVTITATTKEKSTTTKEKVKAACVVTVTSDVMQDTKTLLKDNNGNQVYIKDSKGKYIEATYADYYTAEKFYIKNAVEYTYTGWQTIDDKTYYFDKHGNYVTGTQIIQGVEYNFTSDGVLKLNNAGGTLGIDVSKWNGSINWAAVKNSGVNFAIIRCGYRGSSTGALIEDPTFKKNIQGAKAAGIKVGVYFFTQAVNEVEAVEEASMAISLAKNYGLSYPIFIDTEGSGGRADGISRDTRTAAINAFCRTVANAGYKAGIYASKSWFETKLNTSSLSSYKIWLAQYASKPTYGGRYDMWQYSSKGTVGGISGRVDMNISYLGY